MEAVVTKNPKIMQGAPCFAGTRVTVKTFFEHLESGYSVQQYLDQFPTVSRRLVEQLLLVLEADVERMAVEI